eukprot:TRINITY_DN30213_c0_g1_i1.p1 TRINITY_DN30213_c0_g1~~TRINITY_DN30213_c0_g1_i1.p1  ORF type:complete len:121 (-),score=14.46 TRINITY_DN30213_c0_g1_i1:53-415(-)
MLVDDSGGVLSGVGAFGRKAGTLDCLDLDVYNEGEDILGDVEVDGILDDVDVLGLRSRGEVDGDADDIGDSKGDDPSLSGGDKLGKGSDLVKTLSLLVDLDDRDGERVGDPVELDSRLIL